MKKTITLVLLFILALSITGASPTPHFTLNAGGSALIYEKSLYYSARTGIEIGFLSYKIKALTISIPIEVNYITESTTKSGLLSPSYFKNAVGVEALLSGDKIGGGLGVYYGYEEFPGESALMKYLEGRATFQIILSPVFSIMLPLSYTYTPLGSEISLTTALRISDEL